MAVKLRLAASSASHRIRQMHITRFIAYSPKIIDSDRMGSDVDSEMSFDTKSHFAVSEVDEWEREGYLFRYPQSSYLDLGQKLVLMRPHGHPRVYYDACEPQELKRFVHDRLLGDPYPQGLTLKYFYLRLLEGADRHWTFRFLDMPTEMRLLVYRDLLLHNNPWISNDGEIHSLWPTHPAILQSCKQIYDEAIGVLYDENTFQVTFEATGGGSGSGTGPYAWVHRKRALTHCRHSEYLRIPQGINDYPEFFGRIARLQIRLKFDMPNSTVALLENATWPLNNFLYTLASFLMDGHRLKNLEVKLDISSAVDDSKYGMILYPLRRLRNIPNISIKGHIPATVKAKLVNDIYSNEPMFNTMRVWNHVAAEGRAQLDLLLATHDESDCDCGECQPECIEEARFHIQHLDSLGLTSCFSSLFEERFLVHLHHVKNYLQRVNVDALENLVETLRRSRESLTKYEAISDEGRLEEASKTWTARFRNISSTPDLHYSLDHDWSETFDGLAIENMDECDEGKAAVQRCNPRS